MAEQDKDPSVHLSCLEVLAGKSMIITRPFLTKDLHSADDEIRLAAVRVYAHNLQKESAVVLSLCIDDSYPKIRMEAAIGLRHYLSEGTVKQLEKALSDPEWIVRLQAGLSLKNMGKIGQQILNDQSPEVNKVAYDTAQYVSHFDW
jgi:HEAT repeat protein